MTRMLLSKIRYVVVAIAITSFFSVSLHGDEIDGWDTFITNSNCDATMLGVPQVNGETILLQPELPARNVPQSLIYSPATTAFSAFPFDISNGFKAEFDVLYSSSEDHNNAPLPLSFVIHGDPRGATALAGGGWRGVAFGLNNMESPEISPAVGLQFSPDRESGTGIFSAFEILSNGSLLDRNYTFNEALDGLENGESSTHVVLFYDGSTGMLTSTLSGQFGVNVYGFLRFCSQYRRAPILALREPKLNARLVVLPLVRLQIFPSVQ